MEFKNILKINKESLFKKKEELFSINPSGHFKILIFSFFAFLVLFVVLHAYFFEQIKSNSIFQVDVVEPNSIPKIDQKKLDAVLKRYNEKEQDRQAIGKVLPPVIDPSK